MPSLPLPASRPREQGSCEACSPRTEKCDTATTETLDRLRAEELARSRELAATTRLEENARWSPPIEETTENPNSPFGQAVAGVAGGIGDGATSTYESVTHPVETLKGLSRLMPLYGEEGPPTEEIRQLEVQRATDVGGAIGNGVQNIGETLASGDPRAIGHLAGEGLFQAALGKGVGALTSGVTRAATAAGVIAQRGPGAGAALAAASDSVTEGTTLATRWCPRCKRVHAERAPHDAPAVAEAPAAATSPAPDAPPAAEAATPSPMANADRLERAKELFPGQQQYGTCTLMSCAQVAEQASRASGGPVVRLGEDAMRDIGERVGAYDRAIDGTYGDRIPDVLKELGVPSSVQEPTLANVDRALAEGRGVVTSHDAEVFYGPGSGQDGVHTVMPVATMRDASGKITSIRLSDTGTGSVNVGMRPSKFEESLRGVVVTDQPIWVTP
jgi:hypothetical protein